MPIPGGGAPGNKAAASGDVVDDTSPQLGGNLDIQTNLIVGGGGSTGIAIDSAGIVNMAAQPAFQANNSVTDANQTGDATVVSPVEFDNEIFDQNSDYNASTDTFTAPVTGRYVLSVVVSHEGVTTAELHSQAVITTSNRGYVSSTAVGNLETAHRIVLTIIADMDAGDTAIATTTSSGGTKVVDIGAPETVFSGCLLA